jgi:hypothetical protein
MTVLFIAAALAAVPLSRRFTGDFLSPAAMVVLVWFGTLGLYFLFLLPYQPVQGKAFLYLLGAVGTLAVGIVGGTWLAAHRPTRGAGAAAGDGPDVRRLERWILVYSILGVAGFGWYLVGVVRHLGWEALRNGGTIRLALGAKVIPSEFLFLEFFCVIAPLVAWAGVLSGARIRPRVLALPVVCLLLIWWTTDRTQFFLVVLAGTWMYLYRFGPELSLPRYVRVASIAGALLLLNFWAVSAWTGKTAVGLNALLKARAVDGGTRAGTLSQALPGVQWWKKEAPQDRSERVLRRFSYVYLYATGSYPGFSLLVTSDVKRTYGVHTFYPIFRALDRVGLYPGVLPDSIPPFLTITREEETRLGFNGYTFLWYYYQDFGPAGLFVIPLLIGAVTGIVYGRLRSHRSSPLLLLLMGHLSAALMLSIFVCRFNNTASWYIGLLSVLPFVNLRWPAAPADIASGR